MSRKTVITLVLLLTLLVLASMACGGDPVSATPTPVVYHAETSLVDALGQIAEPVEQTKSLWAQFCELPFTTCP